MSIPRGVNRYLARLQKHARYNRSEKGRARNQWYDATPAGIARKQFYEYTTRTIWRAPNPNYAPRPIISSGPLDPNYYTSFIGRDGLSIYMERQTPEELRRSYVAMIRHERRAGLMSPLTLGRLLVGAP
jgi:hypothetical protein